MTRSEEFLKYLYNIGEISLPVANLANNLLDTIFREIPELNPPRIGPGPDGMVGLTWDSLNYHVNIEVFQNGHVEFFSENLKSNEMLEEETLDFSMSRVFLHELRKTL